MSATSADSGRRGQLEVSGCILPLALVFSIVISSATACFAQLPGGWTAADVGSPGIAGSQSYNSGTYVISGSGTGVANGALPTINTNIYYPDQFHFVYTQVSGDVEIVVHITNINSSDPTTGFYPQAGIALRADLTSGALNSNVFYAPGCTNATPPLDYVQSTSRQTAGNPWPPYSNDNVGGDSPQPTALPSVWLKLDKVGNDVGAYWSRDGAVWIPARATGAFTATGTVDIGMYVASNSNSASASATFDSVYVGAPRLKYKTSWVGNSYNQVSQGDLTSPESEQNTRHISTDIAGLWVNADGTCWTDCPYDEGGPDGEMIKDGKIVRSISNAHAGIYQGNAHEGSVTGDGSLCFMYSNGTPPVLSTSQLNGNYIYPFGGNMSFTNPAGNLAGLAAANNAIAVTGASNSVYPTPMTITTATPHGLTSG